MASQHQFKRELSQLIRKYSAGLQTSEFADVLGVYHHDLAQGSLTPEVELVSEAGPIGLRVTYSTALALERDLDDYLEVGGVCLALDCELEPLSDVVLTVGGMHVRETVTLRGRVVRETPAGVAFQVTLPDEPVAQTLREMPEKMRQAAAEAASRALERAAQTLANQTASANAEAHNAHPSAQPMRQLSDKSVQAHTHGPLELEGEPVLTWELSETGAPAILRELLDRQHLDRQRLAVLDVRFGERRAQVVVDGTEVVDVELYPTSQRESLAGLLDAAGKLDDDQIARARAHVERHGVSMAEALVELDLLSYAQIGVALTTRARFLLGVLWERKQGRAALYSVDALSRRFRVPRSPLAYHIFRRMRDRFERADDEWLDERRSFFRGHLIARADEPPCTVDELDLPAKQRRFVDLVLETPRPLSEVVRISQLGEQETIVLLESLRNVGMLALEETNPWTRRRTKFVQQLGRMQARMHGQNHFDLLGVHWTAYDDEIDSAYQERLESLADDKLPDDLDAESQALVDELRAQLRDSYELLSDQRRRASYRDEHVDRFEKKTALEMFAKQADTAKLRRDLDGAIDAYRRVLELAPGHQQAKRDLEVLVKLREAERGR